MLWENASDRESLHLERENCSRVACGSGTADDEEGE